MWRRRVGSRCWWSPLTGRPAVRSASAGVSRPPPPPPPPRPLARPNVEGVGRALYLDASRRELAKFEDMAANAIKAGSRFVSEGVMLRDEYEDLPRSIQMMRTFLRTEQSKSLEMGTTQKWSLKTWDIAARQLGSMVQERIRQIRAYLDAYGSDLCLKDKRQICEANPVTACPAPCQVESTGALSFLGLNKKCTYPKTLARKLPKYTGPSVVCPFAPAKPLSNATH